MKVLNVLYRLMPSGAEKMLFDAAEAFKEAGVESFILANDCEKGPFSTILEEKGFKIFQIPWRRDRGYLLTFYQLCRKERFDAVHIHVIRGYVGFAIVAKLAGVKVVVKTFHSNFSARDWKRWMWHTLMRSLARCCGTKMVAIGKTVQKNEWDTFRNRCNLVWNFSDETACPFARADVGCRMRSTLWSTGGRSAEDKFILLSVGNCHSESHRHIKNHQLIIRALALLPDNIRAHVLYVHVGEEQDGFPERKLAKELGLSENALFLGKRMDVWELLCAANVYIMSSLHEGLPISGIEAAFAGRHMLLTRVPGLIDFEDVVGEHVTYCDLTPASMSAAIHKMYVTRGENGDWACENGNPTMREAAIKAFSLKAGVSSLVRIYRGEK